MIALAHSGAPSSTTLDQAAFVAWSLAGLICGGICAAAARRALFALAISRRRLLAALAAGTLVTIAMALMALATALYLGALAFDASGLSAAANGPFAMTSVAVALGFQLLVMLIAAALATITTRRGWSALQSSLAG